MLTPMHMVPKEAENMIKFRIVTHCKKSKLNEALNLAPVVFPEVDGAIMMTTPTCSQVTVDEQDAFYGKDRW